MQENKFRHKRMIKKKRRKRIILTLFFFLLFTISIVSLIGYKSFSAIDNTYSGVERGEKSKLRDEKIYVSDDPFSILLLGVEDYSDKYDKGRTDTIMVATLNPKDKTMNLVSLPRDTLVDIPDHGRDKINHSYAYGGKDLTIETVENFLEIPIDYYVTVNFKGFKNIIDELGGVTVDVPFDFYDINKDREKFYFTEGKQKLDGEEALVYARMRKKDPRGDFGRNERQRQIVTGLLNKALSPKTVLKIDNIAYQIGDNIETNMKVKEGLAFAQKYKGFSKSAINSKEFKGEDKYIDGIYYFIPDEEKTDEIISDLQDHLNYTP
ncbi:LCP family protein [Rossellomorea sp. SC111]|uniref:LCP family protein n=1 Tax=Rossellomorea sp. SC111 TaxID=2968985 RepID=UPI00215B1607|nr:LCP family protein [Rossellomorea sp. SC111]MCR8850551.1 LCP family protein [Rossellomorea sp. SC111]